MREWEDYPVLPPTSGIMQDYLDWYDQLLKTGYIRWSYDFDNDVWHIWNNLEYGCHSSFPSREYNLVQGLEIFKSDLYYNKRDLHERS